MNIEKISSIFVAFLENMNFMRDIEALLDLRKKIQFYNQDRRIDFFFI